MMFLAGSNQRVILSRIFSINMEETIEKSNETIKESTTAGAEIILKNDEEFLSRGFELCGLFQKKKELLRELKHHKTPKKEAEIAALNAGIREKDSAFWENTSTAVTVGNKFAFEELSQCYGLDLYEKRMLLFFYFLEFFHVSDNLCPEMELLELFSLDGSDYSRIKNVKYFTRANRLFVNNLVIGKAQVAASSATVVYALHCSAIEKLSKLLNGEKIDEDNKKKEDLHSAFECEEIGMLKVPEYKLEDVVLKESVKDKVMFFLSSLKEPAMESFGIGQTIKNGKGLNILFYGPPGTGKSMLAEGIADYLGRKLLLVETPKIFSRWVGETDKAIAKIFKIAKDNGLVICMDEADSLLYNRCYAGQEHDIRFVNVMLQEIERFEGVAIFTTNLDSHLDPALERRITLRVQFELPDEKMRAEIWKAHIPSAVKVAEDVNFFLLAKRFEFAGGYIKNAVLNALRKIALRKQDMISMEDLVWSGNMEKEGLFNKAQRKGSVGFTALG